MHAGVGVLHELVDELGVGDRALDEPDALAEHVPDVLAAAGAEIVEDRHARGPRRRAARSRCEPMKPGAAGDEVPHERCAASRDERSVPAVLERAAQALGEARPAARSRARRGRAGRRRASAGCRPAAPGRAAARCRRPSARAARRVRPLSVIRSPQAMLKTRPPTPGRVERREVRVDDVVDVREVARLLAVAVDRRRARRPRRRR